MKDQLSIVLRCGHDIQWVGSKGFCHHNVIFRLSKNTNFVKNFVNNPGFCHFLPSQYEDFISTFHIISLLYSCGFVWSHCDQHFIRNKTKHGNNKEIRRHKWHHQYSQAYKTSAVDVWNVTYLLTDDGNYRIFSAAMWNFALIHNKIMKKTTVFAVKTGDFLKFHQKSVFCHKSGFLSFNQFFIKKNKTSGAHLLLMSGGIYWYISKNLDRFIMQQ